MYSAPLDTPYEVLDFFHEVHSFIDEALESGKNVMVHCLAGAHRAGTTGVSYMMKAG
jgi:protein-tyrosine phosphatase